MKSIGAMVIVIVILYFLFGGIGSALHEEFGAAPEARYCVDYTMEVYRCD